MERRSPASMPPVKRSGFIMAPIRVRPRSCAAPCSVRSRDGTPPGSPRGVKPSVRRVSANRKNLRLSEPRFGGAVAVYRYRLEFLGQRQIAAAEIGEFRSHQGVAGDAGPKEALFRPRAQFLGVLHSMPLRNAAPLSHACNAQQIDSDKGVASVPALSLGRNVSR